MGVKFIILAGPSGSGKGTLLEHARDAYPEIQFARSLTTRPPRPGEERSPNRLFVDVERFKHDVEAKLLLEWASYSSHFYGTPKAEVLPFLAEGVPVLKEMEIQGVQQVLTKIPREQVQIVFVHSGPWEVMEARIKARAPISEEELAKRKEHYEEEVQFIPHADFALHNEDGRLAETTRAFDRIIDSVLH